jgi:hypothetical protein
MNIKAAVSPQLSAFSKPFSGEEMGSWLKADSLLNKNAPARAEASGRLLRDPA